MKNVMRPCTNPIAAPPPFPVKLALFFALIILPALHTPLRADQAHVSDEAEHTSQEEAAWSVLEPGLDFREFQLNESGARLAVARVSPADFEFVLCTTSQDAQPARPLGAWGEQYNLAVAINASMYLQDGSTSTGYMRYGTHVNNKRIVARFGAFFVAGPDDAALPPAAIIDRDSPGWEERIERYALVVQNYRMTNAERRILWAPGGPHYSISAMAQDAEGRILFLHCREPVEAYFLAQQLLELPLNVRTVMYVEGGAQAGLLIRSASLSRVMSGRFAADFLVTGNIKAALPNVLGARRIPQKKSALQNREVLPN